MFESTKLPVGPLKLHESLFFRNDDAWKLPPQRNIRCLENAELSTANHSG